MTAARAAIEKMQEPTWAMTHATNIENFEVEPTSSEIWRAVIEEALKEAESPATT